MNPCDVPKYVTPLVIAPVMNDTGVANDYDIAVPPVQAADSTGWDPGNTRSGYK